MAGYIIAVGVLTFFAAGSAPCATTASRALFLIQPPKGGIARDGQTPPRSTRAQWREDDRPCRTGDPLAERLFARAEDH